MIYLSQRDPKWRDVKMGNTPFTISHYGCLLTDVSMLSSYYGEYKSPKELAKKLSFTKDGLLIWSSIPKVLPFKLNKRYYKRDQKALLQALKQPGMAVALQVDGYHWVLGLGVYKFAPWIVRIWDPWNNRKYAFPLSPYKKITGMATFHEL